MRGHIFCFAGVLALAAGVASSCGGSASTGLGADASAADSQASGSTSGSGAKISSGTGLPSGASGSMSGSSSGASGSMSGSSSGASGSTSGSSSGSSSGSTLDAGADATSGATDASAPIPVTVETTCAQATQDYAEDCTCQSGEIAISGGTFTGSTSNMINASQAGLSYGASAQTWRVSCVQPSSGNRLPCQAPFAVCLGGPHTSAAHVETTNCVEATSNHAEDCSCNSGEVAVAGGAFAGHTSYMLNATQAGPSYGGSAQTWRVACVDPTGARVVCVSPFVVCLGSPSSAAVRVETASCAQATSDFAVDCTCRAGEVAISGGAYSGQVSFMLNASQAGPSYGASERVWRVSCVDPTGSRVMCVAPFAVCAASGI